MLETSFRGLRVVWWPNFIQFFFLFFRGWRIQWSIVPEVSEPMVRWPPASCLTASCFCVRRKTYVSVEVKKKTTNFSLYCKQEPPKEDLTVSEKFQLVLDVAQKAQVRHSSCCFSNQCTQIMKRCWFWQSLNSPYRTCLVRWRMFWRR